MWIEVRTPERLSFLDCIACGFGAIILLLVIVKTTEPIVLEESKIDYNGRIRVLQEELHELRGEITEFNRLLVREEEQLSKERLRVARLEGAAAAASSCSAELMAVRPALSEASKATGSLTGLSSPAGSGPGSGVLSPDDELEPQPTSAMAASPQRIVDSPFMTILPGFP